jgi:hypothetical protein
MSLLATSICALLDINLGEEECGPVADALRDAAFPSYS